MAQLAMLIEGEVLVFGALIDLIERFPEGASRDIQVAAELPVFVAIKPLRRVVACGSGRSSQLATIVIVSGGWARARVPEYEPAQLAAQLPGDQVFVFTNRLPLSHAPKREQIACQAEFLKA